MPTITIYPDTSARRPKRFVAVAGQIQTEGSTAGQALDAMTSRKKGMTEAALVILQPGKPDRFFPAEKQRRLTKLMARWRKARDAGKSFPAGDQAELEELADEELRAATARAEFLLSGLRP